MVDVVIPVYRPDEKFNKLIDRLCRQTILPEKIILMYTITGLDEREPERFMKSVLARMNEHLDADNMLEIYSVNKNDFSHGKTRNAGISKCRSPYVLLLTQDAVPADSYLIENLLRMIDDYPDASQVYGRQITDTLAPDYLKYTQRFNYPAESMVKSAEDYDRLGIKTIFCSDVCCMYRRDVFDYIGGFEDVIFNEDMIFARKAIDAGYKICYAADACVVHYHKYSLKQQRKRNFDIAVSQKQHPDVFGDLSSEGEGGRMVKTVLGKLLKKRKFGQFFYYILLSFYKYTGYKLGKIYRILPKKLCAKLSLTPSYWE